MRKTPPAHIPSLPAPHTGRKEKEEEEKGGRNCSMAKLHLTPLPLFLSLWGRRQALHCTAALRLQQASTSQEGHFFVFLPLGQEHGGQGQIRPYHHFPSSIPSIISCITLSSSLWSVHASHISLCQTVRHSDIHMHVPGTCGLAGWTVGF